VKRCIACHMEKPEVEFPAPGSLTCRVCAATRSKDEMPMFVSLDDEYDPDAAGMRAQENLNKMNPLINRAMRSAMKSEPSRPGEYLAPIRTQRATQSDHSIAKALLRKNNWDKAAAMGEWVERITAEPDDRPLIDKLHEATFSDAVSMQWFKDKYALRMLLRKAHCFTLDKVTSAMVADFSIAIAKDLESARRMAIPPFPVTWIEIDNVARLDRIKAMGIQLTKTAAGETEAGPPVERVGWLITPGVGHGYNATYVTEVSQGVTSAPLSYWWHSEEPSQNRESNDPEGDRVITRLCFGVTESNVGTTDALPVETPLHGFDIRRGTSMDADVLGMMAEIGGELRHIWGFLIALGAGQLGIEASYTAQPKPVTERKAPNGKPLLPLEHKVLHLHLAKKMTVEKVIARSITHHKHRWHEVRGHFRLLKSGRRVPVKAHARGDERLGKIEKTYKVER
jgi:hypothetical protein